MENISVRPPNSKATREEAPAEVPSEVPSEETVAEVPSKVEPTPTTFIVYFDFDKAGLDDAAKAVLEEAIAASKKLGGALAIDGNTDRAGSHSYNQILSELRVLAVAKYMAARDDSVSLTAINAYGEKKPMVHTADGVPEAANRRVEINIERQ